MEKDMHHFSARNFSHSSNTFLKAQPGGFFRFYWFIVDYFWTSIARCLHWMGKWL